ncbi:hypothetical protein ABT093_39970 [Kitasatospora sp. NPDC002551]|uniref:hypothetical protein n=1 Tax=Kitasatospora sp. NPDC002551 TaxID=3154539 RepID=UPI0033333DC8
MTLYGIPPAGFRRFMVPENGREHGRCIVDAAHGWWLDNRGGTGEVAIAVGTLAGLALCSPSRADGPDYGPLLIPLDDRELADALRASWNSLWASDPALADAAGPLHAWLADPSESDIRGLADYARVLVRAGLLEYCSDLARCESEDLLGLLLQRMRGHGQKQATGEFFTPSIASDPAGEILLTDLPAPGAVLLEPCAGTGTMVRAAAAALRFQGLDPGRYHWWLNDIDAVNSACCAVNSRLWRLGSSVTVSCGDALGDPRNLEEPTHRRAERAIAEHKHRPLLYPTRTRPPHWHL